MRSVVVAVLIGASAGACAPKTKYVAPAAATAPAFKENANWKTAQPADAAIRGNWWEAFGDSQLDALEAQIDVSNESLKGAEARFAQARAVVVPDASMAADARTLMCDQLKAVGFSEVTMLSKPAQPSDAVEAGPRVVAA